LISLLSYVLSFRIMNPLIPQFIFWIILYVNVDTKSKFPVLKNLIHHNSYIGINISLDMIIIVFTHLRARTHTHTYMHLLWGAIPTFPILTNRRHACSVEDIDSISSKAPATIKWSQPCQGLKKFNNILNTNWPIDVGECWKRLCKW
jgi:hypothetical protein